MVGYMRLKCETMEEYEVKLMEIDVEKTLGILQQKTTYNGGQFLSAVFFEPPTGSAEPDVVIRIRTEMNLASDFPRKTIFTVKGPKTSCGERDGFAKHRSEQEVIVEAGPNSMTVLSKMLLMLGCRDKGSFLEKLRLNFCRGEINYALDIWPAGIIPAYLEIETENPSQISNGLDILGVGISDTVSFDMKDVMAHYGCYAKDIRFSEEERDYLRTKYGGLLS